jgi:thiamine-monophosphate kinase
LLNPAWGSDLDEAERRNLIQAHQRPQPRLDVLPQLWELDNPLRVAGMDSSDGLADAILQICRASHVGGRIERDLIPLPSALTRTTSISPDQALEWALYGGEDFELILCLDSQIAQKLVEQLGNGAAIVGQVVEGSEVQLIDKGQSTSLSLIQGFQHF